MLEDENGFLTRRQLYVLKKRYAGVKQRDIAKELKTTRQNISLIESRARDNIKKAKETLRSYAKIRAKGTLILEKGMHKIDIPQMIVKEADLLNIRLRANFTRLYNEIKFNAPGCVGHTHIEHPIEVLILDDGDVKISPKK